MSTAANIKARLAPKKKSVAQYLLPTAHCPGSYLLPIAHDPVSIAQAAGEENLGERSLTGKSQSLTSFCGIAFTFIFGGWERGGGRTSCQEEGLLISDFK